MFFYKLFSVSENLILYLGFWVRLVFSRKYSGCFSSFSIILNALLEYLYNCMGTYTNKLYKLPVLDFIFPPL